MSNLTDRERAMTDTCMKVTQADRDAADEFAGKAYLSILAHEALEVAFARHREAVITAAMAQDKAEIERLRKALTHYAKDYDHNHGCSQWDGGAIARQALAAASLKAKDASDD